MTTIADVFDLPRPEDLRALGFVVKLRDGDPEARRLVDDYVVTPTVEKELPRILDDMRQVLDRGEEYGRFVHGSFGSGKSHFLSMLALLLEGSEPAWARFRGLLGPHEAWLRAANLLVVRLHMLSVRGRTTGLDRAVYEAFNQALARRGKGRFEFLDLEAIFQEVRREASEFGDIVWKRLEAVGIVGSREDFETVASGRPEARERFVRAWLEYKGRSASFAGLDPRWGLGLTRMAEHARREGFGGIVLLLDEFLLWLAEKSGQEFVREVNDLNVIVDHDTGQRALPMFVFVARQRDLREFFPDLVDEARIHEQIDHHAQRFEVTRLEDVELRHVVKGRVLKAKDQVALESAILQLGERHQKALPALLGREDLLYLRDVYPFHPVLIETLVDVTALMQRERTALRLLYELLVLHHRDLPLGEFLPVGSAFAAIFPPSGVEASKKVDTLQDIHRQYYQRLAPAMRKMVDEDPAAFPEERRRALDQFVKTVLLAEVSSRLKQQGMTLERLVQLNSVDVEGETFRSKVRLAELDLLALAQRVPDLQIVGQGKSATVRYVLGRVSLGEFLGRARTKVDNPNQRLRTFWGALKGALGIDRLRGFEEGCVRGEWEVQWRRTSRKGAIQLGNIREMPYDDFDPPDGTFKILIDYPWDEPPHTVEADRQRAANVRRTKGPRYSIAWLPRHLAPFEMNVLTELGAVRYLLSAPGQDELLDLLGPQDRAQLLEQARTRERTLEGQLAELLIDVYVRQGEFLGLVDVDRRPPRETLSENLRHAACLLMDRRFPQHPDFEAEPRAQDLEALLEWMVLAGEPNVSIPYDEALEKILRTIGKPLELVSLGQGKGTLRFDSRYLKDILSRVDQDSVGWGPIADHLRETYGLPARVIDLFLSFVSRRDHRALDLESGEPVETRIGMPSGARIRLERGRVVAAPDWHRLRDLGSDLLGASRPAATRSLLTQDRYASILAAKGRERRDVLQSVHERLVRLGVDPGAARTTEIATANARLAALVQSSTDSHRLLSEFLAAWPEEEPASLRILTGRIEAIRDALAELDEHARGHLRAAIAHPVLGGEASAHLEDLDQRLSASQADSPLTREWVATWNRAARDLVGRLVARPAPLPPPAPDPVPLPPRPARSVLVRKRIRPGDASALDRFMNEVRSVLSRLEGDDVEIVLLREEGSD